MIATDADKRKAIVSLLELYPSTTPDQTLDSTSNDALEAGLIDGVISRAEAITLRQYIFRHAPSTWIEATEELS